MPQALAGRRKLAALALAATFLLTTFAGADVAAVPARGLAGAPRDPCPPGAPARVYEVTALPLPVSYNRWGSLDLEGRLYVPNESVDPLLADAGAKLAAAGLGDAAARALALRDAVLRRDVHAATEEAAALVAEARKLRDPSVDRPLQRPVDVSPLATPLVLRAHVGDCVTVKLTDLAPEPVSLHVHAVVAPPGAGAAVGLEAPDLAWPGETREYRVFVPDEPGMEGAHFLHSHADPRDQTRHGLFGALVAEPRGAFWNSTLDARTPAPHALEAIIDVPDGPDFREFVKIYHDEVELVNGTLKPYPVISEYGEYGPGTKGINLRTEPFLDRFRHHDARGKGAEQAPGTGEVARNHDKSMAYSSYTYGDPGTWMQRSYLGDPVKFRLVNAGPGQHHIHHLHGGGIRWRATPLAEPSQFAAGLVKENPVQLATSQRLDVQNVAPGESFNLEPEGGSGGVQQSVGDFLYHCHIAEHYLAGMWGIWRVHNTLQPDLAEIPERAGLRRPAVDSRGLAQAGLAFPDGTPLDEATLARWVEPMLPPPGVPGEEDASVWDWRVNATTGIYEGEPETDLHWPNYPEDAPGKLAPGERPPILFDPETGKLAYPHLRPHFGKRPPFAPDHGPAPYLGENATAQRPDGLCQGGGAFRQYDLVATRANVSFNRFDKDANGQIFVRTQDRGRADTVENATSLVLRANAGDCVQVTLASALAEKGPSERRKGVHTKTNIHVHLVQFDVQASDGVVAGYNYETSVRPIDGSSKATDAQDPSAPVVTRTAAAGAREGGDGTTLVAVRDVRPFLDARGVAKQGSLVGIGLGLATFETAKIVSVARDPGRNSGNLTLAGPLRHAHGDQEPIGYEFVTYRWYPDVELGVVYFHDHVDGLNTWRHGLFGSLVVEPANSTWRPHAPATDGATAPMADILPRGGEPFRELVLHFSDRNCVAPESQCLNSGVPKMPQLATEPASFNLRAEPLHRRNATHPLWNAATWGADAPGTAADETQLPQDDPSTPILHAYPGDRTIVRFLYAGSSMSRAVGTFSVTGHRFPVEQELPGGRTSAAVSVAISSQHNLELECGAGGCARIAGDHLYWMAQPEYVERGAWGILRVLDAVDEARLPTLASNPRPEPGALPDVPPDKLRRHRVAAVDGLVAHAPAAGIASLTRRFVVLDADAPYAPLTGDAATPPDPLVLRARPGDVVEVTLENHLRVPEGSPPRVPRVSLHAGLLSAEPGGFGVNVGRNPDSTVGPGGSRTYRWHVDREVGVVDLVSLADPVRDAAAGLHGALVVEPEGATWTHDVGPVADLTVDGRRMREHVLLFATGDAQFQSSTMPYHADVRTPHPLDARNHTWINYGVAPLARRGGVYDGPEVANRALYGGGAGAAGASTCHADPENCGVMATELRSPALWAGTWGAPPATPTVEARQGEPLVLRVVGAAGDQLVAFHVDGHRFAQDPDMPGCRFDLASCRSNLVSTVTVGPRETRDVWIPAAGPGGAGDFLYRNHREAYFEAGQWGLLRVT